MAPLQFEVISFIVLFAIVLFVILVVLIKQWRRNSRAPKLIVTAKVASKHIQTSCRIRRGSSSISHRTKVYWYFVTFEAEGGVLLEFSVNKRVYVSLKEATSGKLTFQGTRYLGFESAKK
ncbi:DUF2500 domain-containing protein [Massiliimalia timonensis]|uniref:DUF2500 domain-containing protein n=1 Tax=Massiliimalia timonensis TaxID=1987501 RepID=UPI001319CC15|nr:DUF2500 domain-containing protein [Massiliimalia timonensis]MBS7175085.1 DUF2500 domain-containing protein [Clostridiales bacterium]